MGHEPEAVVLALPNLLTLERPGTTHFLERLRPRYHTGLVVAGTAGSPGGLSQLSRLATMADVIAGYQTGRSQAVARRTIEGLVRRLGVAPEVVLWVDGRSIWRHAASTIGLAALPWGSSPDRLRPVRSALGQRQTTYAAAGGVVIVGGAVVVLIRPQRDEVRLPKGHIESGETAQSAARREVAEETGYLDTAIEADLGHQWVEFDLFPRRGPGWHVARDEHYFRMRLASEQTGERPREARKFTPRLLAVGEALTALSVPAEREWLRRALAIERPATPGG